MPNILLIIYRPLPTQRVHQLRQMDTRYLLRTLLSTRDPKYQNGNPATTDLLFTNPGSLGAGISQETIDALTKAVTLPVPKSLSRCT
jgi:hypothetical protein